MKNEYRIAEYKDCFRIQKKITYTFKLFFYTSTEHKWVTILKDGSQLCVINSKNKEYFEFKSKEDCLSIISDLEKYPIYHEVSI